MAKKVAVIHTSAVSLDEIKGLFAKLMPSVQLMNIIDDSLLGDVMKNGGVTRRWSSGCAITPCRGRRRGRICCSTSAPPWARRWMSPARC